MYVWYRTRHRPALLLSLLFLAALGCDPGVVKVTGRATRGGEPVPNVLVYFVPERGRPSWGRTDADGNFALNYDRRQDGALVGRHTVKIYALPNPKEEASGQPPKLHKDMSHILKTYGEDSPLKIDVSSDRHLDLRLDD